MDSEKNPLLDHETSQNWQDLVALAEQDTEESWEKIDETLPQIAQNPKFVKVAEKALKDPNCLVRDLAASTIEASDIIPGDEVKEKLRSIALRPVAKENDQPYDTFHSAFALFKHGDRSPEIIGVLSLAAQDEATAEAAKAYLTKLNNNK